ncbi:C-type lectin domain family 4 member G-like [Cololabis saira]|uniref:C-type lectin domain family 4 member G-like n=1 Tax=Cololabis saira TaxID=129043 RepID=UPI002AD50C6A|nr:C-type lectin domain family 4 member G-like [Cololabis saira]
MNTECQPCVRGWTLYQNKCYLFVRWRMKTWYESREFCKNRAADLVVIDDLQEQEFISRHIEFYHSEYHGYWLGLRRKDDNWTWIDGRKDTLGFWIQGTFPDSNSYALMIFGKNVTENWSKNEPGFKNRFICEREALIRSD